MVLGTWVKGVSNSQMAVETFANGVTRLVRDDISLIYLKKTLLDRHIRLNTVRSYNDLFSWHGLLESCTGHVSDRA